jgi:hypothetical protein
MTNYATNAAKITTPFQIGPFYGINSVKDLSGSGMGLYTAETTQRAMVGARCISEDGRVWKYCRTGTTYGVLPAVGAYNANMISGLVGATATTCTVTSAVAPTQLGDATGKVGCNCITVTMGETAGGVTQIEKVLKDELVGGYAIIGDGGSQHPCTRMIIANDPLDEDVAGIWGAAETTTFNIYLDGPLTQTIDGSSRDVGTTCITAATTYIEILLSPYCNMVGGTDYAANAGYVTFLCMPEVRITSAEVAAQYALGNYWFFWGQTWGPRWITSNSITNQVANDRSLYFVGNGSVAAGTTATTTLYQRAGFCMEATASSQPGLPLCMLQLSI